MGRFVAFVDDADGNLGMTRVVVGAGAGAGAGAGTAVGEGDGAAAGLVDFVA